MRRDFVVAKIIFPTADMAVSIAWYEALGLEVSNQLPAAVFLTSPGSATDHDLVLFHAHHVGVSVVIKGGGVAEGVGDEDAATGGVKGAAAGFEGCGDVVATGTGADALLDQRVAFVAAGVKRVIASPPPVINHP